VSTQPTPKGLQAINPFSPLFGLHMLDRKVLKSFYEGKDRTLLLRLLEAEKSGLITVTILPPLIEDPSQPSGWEIFPQPMLNASDAKPAGAGLARHVLPDHPRPGEDNIAAYRSWGMARVKLLEVLIRNHLYPSLAEECQRDLVRLGKETVVEEAASNFEAMLRVGPYCQPFMNSRQVG
jgi:hypothetical protein